jgi:hypothetical protein
MHLACFKRACPVDDPNVILSIHRNADSLAENPVIREGLRPQRIDFESRSSNSRGFDRSSFLQDDTCNEKCAEQSHKDHTDVEITLHASSLWIEERFLLAAFYINMTTSTRVLDFKEVSSIVGTL